MGVVVVESNSILIGNYNPKEEKFQGTNANTTSSKETTNQT